MKPDRLIGFDVARTLAFVGMVIVNFKTVMAMHGDPSHPLMGLMGILEGRAAALFVILAGCGISMLTQKARVDSNADLLKVNRLTLQKRALFLFLFGLAYSPIWPADILHFYGLYMVLASFLIASVTRTLFFWTGVIISSAYIMLFTLNYENGWDFDALTYVDFWTLKGMFRHMFYNGFHPFFPWASFMIYGLWLGRLDWNNKKLVKRILYFGFLVGVGMELLSQGIITVALSAVPVDEGDNMRAIFGTEPMPPNPFYMLAACGWATGVIGLCILLTKHFKSNGWLPLVYAGQMALTLYVAHVIVGMGLVDMTSNLENRSPGFILGYALGFSLLSILFAFIWRRKFERGPLEWVMRKVAG